MDHPVRAFLSQAFILVTAGDNFGVYPLCRYGPGRDLPSAPPPPAGERGHGPLRGGGDRGSLFHPRPRAPPHPPGDRPGAAARGAPDTPPPPGPGSRGPGWGRIDLFGLAWFGEAPSPARPGLPGAGLSWVMRSRRGAAGAVGGSGGGAPVQEGARGGKCRPQFSINPDASKVNRAGQGRASGEGREEASDRRLSRAEPGLFPARE